MCHLGITFFLLTPTVTIFTNHLPSTLFSHDLSRCFYHTQDHFEDPRANVLRIVNVTRMSIGEVHEKLDLNCKTWTYVLDLNYLNWSSPHTRLDGHSSKRCTEYSVSYECKMRYWEVKLMRKSGIFSDWRLTLQRKDSKLEVCSPKNLFLGKFCLSRTSSFYQEYGRNEGNSTLWAWHLKS